MRYFARHASLKPPSLQPPRRASLPGMTKHSPITPAAETLPAVRHDGWTPARQAAFLNELATSHCVASAARAVGMSRQSAYGLRARLKGEPFDLAWQAALVCRFDALAEAALERALNGVEVPHYYRGELVGTSRKYDERLTVALLAMRASFRTPPPRYDTDLQAAYRADDFGPLVNRVEKGPETWREETGLLHAQWAEEFAQDDEDESDDAGDAN